MSSETAKTPHPQHNGVPAFVLPDGSSISFPSEDARAKRRRENRLFMMRALPWFKWYFFVGMLGSLATTLAFAALSRKEETLQGVGSTSSLAVIWITLCLWQKRDREQTASQMVMAEFLHRSLVQLQEIRSNTDEILERTRAQERILGFAQGYEYNVRGHEIVPDSGRDHLKLVPPADPVADERAG